MENDIKYNTINALDETIKHLNDAKNHPDYKDNGKAQRDFAVAITNLETARMWANKGFYEE